MQRLLSELTPGKAKKDLTPLQAKRILASVRPRDVAGKTRKRLALEQLTDPIAVDQKIKALTKELKAMVKASGSSLMDLPGVGPIVAARVLADAGEIVRHRLPRAGNRRMNPMIHIAATTQIRLHTPGRAYYLRKLAAGKTKAESLRCLNAGSQTPSTASCSPTPNHQTGDS